ncbi:MAG: hypothetical protein JWN29_1226 [Acidimicrobiales bacterium]|nr:hypothetical protein [Acidimicrobiales bacterium]
MITLPASTFVPIALGFFGLGTGYLIWGPQELFGFPRRDRAVDRSMGLWGVFLPGLCQVVTGIILFIGLTWFEVFQGNPALYMAAVAFSAYGIHWFALGLNRYQENDPRPNVGMSVAFIVLSVVGAVVFFHADDWPVGLLFCGLAAVYVSELPASVGARIGELALGFCHVVVGLWLMYLSSAVLLDLAAGYHWRS